MNSESQGSSADEAIFDDRSKLLIKEFLLVIFEAWITVMILNIEIARPNSIFEW